jgi:hypothetical protein
LTDDIKDDLMPVQLVVFLRYATLLATSVYAVLGMYLWTSLNPVFLMVAWFWIPPAISSYFYFWRCHKARPYTTEKELLYASGRLAEGIFQQRPPLPVVAHMHPHSYSHELAPGDDPPTTSTTELSGDLNEAEENGSSGRGVSPGT